MTCSFIKEIDEYIKKYEALLLSSKNMSIKHICKHSKHKKSPENDENYPT